MAQNRMSGVWLERKQYMKEFKGIWMPNEVVRDEKLSDKGKIVYSIILALSKNNDCIISNSYISELLNVSKTQVSRIINTLRKDWYIEIELIHTSHDTDYSVGFIITEKEKSMVYVTDTGYINRKFLAKMKNKDIYIIESNHDEAMLMDGPYPRFLKERVISDKGHLSNKTTARYLKQSVGEKTKYIVLAHLSEKNNTEELAYKETKEAVNNDNIKIIVAKQDEESELLEV